MNSKQRLRSWSEEWTAYRSMAATPVHAPAPPDPAAADAEKGGGFFTVGIGDIPGTLLDRLNSAIALDDAQRALQGEKFTVAVTTPGKGLVPIQRGQVRQLNPELKPAWTRPVHVLVLTVEAGRDRALVAPFGPLHEPAFEAELSTEIEDESLAVLCLWNATWMPLPCLAHSWWLMDCFEELLQEAAALRKSLAEKKGAPPALRERTGPPLIHPQDPRHAYVDSEEDLLDDLSQDI
ncbi:hypothetical protein [Prosthecobacter sp.]|uniref:hypothetical protein n=1 Tax=Prosthecobacter sp. TaxID=1965333 RepID=UPI003782F4C2